MNFKSISLVITTFNNIRFLEPVLNSAFKQSFLPNEIIIADDGSKDETKKFVESMAKNSPVPLVYTWQEDQGFRAARSRNNGAREATGDILCFIDGDMVLHEHFLYDHLKRSKTNQFLQGSRIRLSDTLTKKLLSKKKFKIPKITTLGVLNRFYMLRLGILASLHKNKQSHIKGVRTCNFSLPLSLFKLVNGFDNTFIGWGREDSELVLRLINVGAKRRDIKNLALAFHLYHNEEVRKSLEENENKLNLTLNKKLQFASDGLNEARLYKTFKFKK